MAIMYRLYPRLIQEMVLDFARHLGEEARAVNCLAEIRSEMQRDLELVTRFAYELRDDIVQNNRRLLQSLEEALRQSSSRQVHEALKAWHEKDCRYRQQLHDKVGKAQLETSLVVES